MNAPREILEKALLLQEQNKPLEALQQENEALLQFAQSKDYAGMAEIVVLRSKTLKHLYQQSDDKNYLVLARAEASAAVEIAENTSNKAAAAIPYFVLAQMHEALEEFPQAKIAYQKTLYYLPEAPQPQHNRKSVAADIKGHLAYCEFKSGDKNAVNQALEALQELESTTDANKYEYNVWLSGAHMRIATMYHQLKSPEAKVHLDKAKQIIDSDEQLILRNQQWERLNQTILGETKK